MTCFCYRAEDSCVQKCCAGWGCVLHYACFWPYNINDCNEDAPNLERNGEEYLGLNTASIGVNTSNDIKNLGCITLGRRWQRLPKSYSTNGLACYDWKYTCLRPFRAWLPMSLVVSIFVLSLLPGIWKTLYHPNLSKLETCGIFIASFGGMLLSMRIGIYSVILIRTACISAYDRIRLDVSNGERHIFGSWAGDGLCEWRCCVDPTCSCCTRYLPV